MCGLMEIDEYQVCLGLNLEVIQTLLPYLAT